MVDEGLGAEVARVLRGADWNAVFADELGLLDATREAIDRSTT